MKPDHRCWEISFRIRRRWPRGCSLFFRTFSKSTCNFFYSFRETAYLFVGELVKNLSEQTSPIIKVNCLTAACKLIELGNYPILLLTEIYLMPCLRNVINFVINRPDFKYFTSFFQEEGYSNSIPYLQNLSYNFVNLACQFIQLAAFVKPLKIY